MVRLAMTKDELLLFPIDTKVMVSEDGKLWLRRYLHHFASSMSGNGKLNAITFPVGCDSWTSKDLTQNGMSPRMTVWTLWRFPEEGE